MASVYEALARRYDLELKGSRQKSELMFAQTLNPISNTSF